MFGLFKGKSANPERDAAKKNTSEYNSLIEDQHVDKNAEEHMVVFRKVKDRVEAMRLKDIRIRGLKIENHLQGGEILAKVEVLCGTEEAISGFLEVIKYF